MIIAYGQTTTVQVLERSKPLVGLLGSHAQTKPNRSKVPAWQVEPCGAPSGQCPAPLLPGLPRLRFLAKFEGEVGLPFRRCINAEPLCRHGELDKDTD